MSEVCVSLLLILTEKKKKNPELGVWFYPTAEGRKRSPRSPSTRLRRERARWLENNKNEKLALRFSHNHTCKNYADIRLQHPAKMSFFCTNESSVMLRRKWKKKINIKKNKRRLGGKILHHSLSNIFAYRCKSDRGSVGVLRWFSSQRRCPVCRGPTAERVPSPPAPPPPPASPPPLSWPWAPGSSCTPWLWAAGWRCCWPCSFPGTCWCWSRWAGRWPWRWETRGGENGYITWGWHDTAVEIWKRCHMISSKDFM